MYSVWFPEYTATISLNKKEGVIFLTEIHSVLCEVRNEQHESQTLLTLFVTVHRPKPLPAPYTGCPRRNVRDFGRVFLMLNYTDITQNTYVQSWTVTEIMAREKCGRHRRRNTVRRPWRHTCPMHLPDQRDMGMQWPWRVRYSTVALTSQVNRSAAACVKYLEV